MTPPAPGRPRVALLGDATGRPQVRRWLLQSGADPDAAGPPDAAILLTSDAVAPVGVPVLDASEPTRDAVVAFVRTLQGKPPHDPDTHGSPQAWPRGSYGTGSC